MKTINAEGGVLGHPLQLIVRDDKAEPNVGVSQARDLVLSEHVKFLAGTCTSAVGKSVTRLVANPSHVVYTVGVGDPTVYTGSGYSFRHDPDREHRGRQRGRVCARSSTVENRGGDQRGLQLWI